LAGSAIREKFQAEVTGMRRLNVIGIGAGDPEYLTVQAIKALNRTDVFFFTDKGDEKNDLLHLRNKICDRYVESPRYRIVEMRDPSRDVGSPLYGEAVREWHEKRVELWEKTVETELADEQVGSFLVWGDPAFYDSTLRVFDAVQTRGAFALELDVIPGISAIQALAARHGISLTQIGRSLTVTTGRQLDQGWPEGATDVVVMLDANCSFRKLDDDLSIYWGAFLGTDDEILISGTVGECGETIAEVRSAARTCKGWMFDTYLLRRRDR
jgi:precorrin-6A synthase